MPCCEMEIRQAAEPVVVGFSMFESGIAWGKQDSSRRSTVSNDMPPRRTENQTARCPAPASES